MERTLIDALPAAIVAAVARNWEPAIVLLE